MIVSTTNDKDMIIITILIILGLRGGADKRGSAAHEGGLS